MNEIKENRDLQWALDHSMNTAYYPDVFDLNIGMDFHLDEHPEWYPSYTFWHNKRTVKIEITSYCGMCWNAIHYYAKIIADGIKMCEDYEEKGEIKTRCHGGYLGEEYKNLPREKKAIWDGRYEIDVVRPLTQAEIDHDPDRWYAYQAGESTHCFESKNEVIEMAKKIVELRFPGWEVEVEDNS